MIHSTIASGGKSEREVGLKPSERLERLEL